LLGNLARTCFFSGTGGTVTFKYDPFGKRIYKSSSGGTSVFGGWRRRVARASKWRLPNAYGFQAWDLSIFPRLITWIDSAFEASRQVASQCRKEQTLMAWFYEIRKSNNTLLKREGGFSTQDAAKFAVRAYAKKIKMAWHLGMPNVGTMMIGQNAEMPTRD
jgi:hypothetical protein